MDPSKFADYTSLKRAGRKREAEKALSDFVRSFESLSDKIAWCRDSLPNLELNRSGRIPHRLYEGIVFPVLLSGYKQRDPWSLLWLAKTIYNLISSQDLHEQIDFKPDLDLLKESFALDDQSTEIREALLQVLVSGFEYSEHEWPSGILYGQDGASPEEIVLILDDIALARQLDPEGRVTGYLWSFEQKVRLYQSRLQT